MPRFVAAAFLACSPLLAITPTADELQWSRHWAENVGNWQLNEHKYPQGLQPLAELLHSDQRELMLWFEPERVVRDTHWYRQHREWLLDAGGSSLLMMLRDSNARRFVTDFISSRVQEYQLGCYRQDFNMDLRPYQATDQWMSQG